LAIVYHAKEAEDTWGLFRSGISQCGHRGASCSGRGRGGRVFSRNRSHDDEVDGETQTGSVR